MPPLGTQRERFLGGLLSPRPEEKRHPGEAKGLYVPEETS